MNTYSRAQGMDNRLNMLFNQELDNESQYINSHPFSSINMSLGGEVRYIAPIWPWNAPKFKSIDWRTQPPPRRIPGLTKHDQGKLFEQPKGWSESTDTAWKEEQKPPPAFPYTKRDSLRDGNAYSVGGGVDANDSNVVMTGNAARARTGGSRPPTHGSRPPTNRSQGDGGGGTGSGGEHRPFTNTGLGGGREDANTNPLRLNLPVSMLPGRPLTNGNSIVNKQQFQCTFQVIISMIIPSIAFS
jgi:hypothetical protein